MVILSESSSVTALLFQEGSPITFAGLCQHGAVRRNNEERLLCFLRYTTNGGESLDKVCLLKFKQIDAVFMGWEKILQRYLYS